MWLIQLRGRNKDKEVSYCRRKGQLRIKYALWVESHPVTNEGSITLQKQEEVFSQDVVSKVKQSNCQVIQILSPPHTSMAATEHTQQTVSLSALKLCLLEVCNGLHASWNSGIVSLASVLYCPTSNIDTNRNTKLIPTPIEQQPLDSDADEVADHEED